MIFQYKVKIYFKRLWFALLGKDYVCFVPWKGQIKGSVKIYGIDNVQPDGGK